MLRGGGLDHNKSLLTFREALRTKVSHGLEELTCIHSAVFRAPFTNAPELTHMLTESKYLGKEKVTFFSA